MIRSGVDARLIALGFGNFIIGTGTMLVPGMLTTLARGFDVEVPVAAQLITVYAFACCVGAPLLASLTSRIDRRLLLAGIMTVFAAAHFAAALVTSIEAMAALRVLAATGAALFTPQAAATLGQIVPPERRGAALASVFLGWSIASVLGLPLNAWIGLTFGWQAGFVLVGCGALLAAAGVAATLPAGLHTAPVDAAMWRRLGEDRPLMAAVSVTAIQSAAQFASFSFLVPAFKAFLNAGPATISTLLAVFGAMGLVGNLLAARLLDRVGAPRVVLAALVSMIAAQGLWYFAPGSLPLVVACLVLWGLGCFSANSAQQARLVGMSPGLAPVTIALNSSSIYLGQALGTAAGAAVLAASSGTDGYARLALASLPMFIAAIAVSRWSERHRRAA